MRIWTDENDDNIFSRIQNSLDMIIFARKSSRSGMIGLEVETEKARYVVCTSAGTVGLPESFGKSDAVMTCENPIGIR